MSGTLPFLHREATIHTLTSFQDSFFIPRVHRDITLKNKFSPALRHHSQDAIEN